MRIVLLPGLDGTGMLFAPLLAETPPGFEPQVVALPQVAAYDALFERVVPQLPAEPFLVLGESFSGPLALRIAGALPERVRAVILCNSFLRSPLHWTMPWNVARAAGRVDWRTILRAVRATPLRIVIGRLRALFALRLEPPLLVMPVLDLRGTRDRLVPRREVDHAQRMLPMMTRREVDAAHFLLQERPVAAWREIASLFGSPR